MTEARALAQQIVDELRTMGSAENVAGMARFGISGGDVLGVSVTELRKFARRYRNNHELALALWSSGVHEARILASLVDDHLQVSEAQMEMWVSGFDSWDLCDQCCFNLFDKTSFALDKAREWANRDEQFIRRAGFALMAARAVHAGPDEADSTFLELLPSIEAAADDDRNFVKKAVNWALRQIGKRNLNLNRHAVALARELAESTNRTRRWIGRDALRELTSDATLKRIRKREGKN